jgi:hypothetical protein
MPKNTSKPVSVFHLQSKTINDSRRPAITRLDVDIGWILYASLAARIQFEGVQVDRCKIENAQN